MEKREFIGWEDAREYITRVKGSATFALVYDYEADEIFARVIQPGNSFFRGAIIWDGRWLGKERQENFLAFVEDCWLEYWARKIGDDEIVNCWEKE